MGIVSARCYIFQPNKPEQIIGVNFLCCLGGHTPNLTSGLLGIRFFGKCISKYLDPRNLKTSGASASLNNLDQ